MAGAVEEEFLDLTPSGPTPPDPSEYLTVASCVVSLCCGIILLVLVFRRYITLGTCHFMFVCLTIADMMTAGGNLYGVVNVLITYGSGAENVSSLSPTAANNCIETRPECKAQSFITTWSSMCCFLWTIVIEFYCFFCIWKSQHHTPLSRGAKWAISLFCWLLPLSITVAALVYDVLGQDNSATSGGWCWISSCGQLVSKRGRILWMLFTGKFWEILSYLTISNLILLQIYKMYSRTQRRRFYFAESEATIIIPEAHQVGLLSSSASGEPSSYELQKFLFWIPMLLILARIWGTIRFFFNVSEIINNGIPESVVQANKVLLYFHGIGDSSQATCNFILAMIFMRLLRSETTSRRSSSITEQSMYSVRNGGAIAGGIVSYRRPGDKCDIQGKVAEQFANK